MRRTVVACTVVMLAFAPAPALAWGFAAHRLIMRHAIDLLPPELKPFFQRFKEEIVVRVVDPDLWRNVGWDAEEGPRHFLDMDAYGAPPFAALPRDRRAAEARFGRKTIEREGVLPWHGGMLARRLRDELRRRDLEAARVTAGHLAHYAADATMPLHATENHDGQETGQRGLHQRIEARLIDADLGEYTRHAWKAAPRRPIAPEGADGALFAALEEAYGKIDVLLAADRRARRDTKVGSRLYYRRLHADLVEVLAERIGAAAVLTAALWEGACLQRTASVAPRP